jgi:hypothetical protein
VRSGAPCADSELCPVRSILVAMIYPCLLADVPIQIPWQFKLIVAVGALMIVFGWLKQSRRSRTRGDAAARFAGATFERCPFLSSAELDFFFALEQAVGNQFRIAMKVRLGDLVDVRGQDSAAWTARNKTWQKHVDFVLCTVREVQPALVIELDDSSHGRPDRVERDGFVDGCLGAVGIRVLHVACRRGYDVRRLGGEIRACLAG